jgi:hypothetical protein
MAMLLLLLRLFVGVNRNKEINDNILVDDQHYFFTAIIQTLGLVTLGGNRRWSSQKNV